VGSANFTDRAQTRNVEVGALLSDTSFAQALLGQFRGAVAAGVFVHRLGRAGRAATATAAARPALRAASRPWCQ
jgi:phosphatidylserine/phosphatidylglycerophosphate/cardiolipin synthase-like enzyme